MDPNNSKKKKLAQKVNPLEVIREAGKATAGAMNEQLIKPMPKDIMDQIFGPRRQNVSTEFAPGESVEMNELMSGERENRQKEEKRLKMERELLDEERLYVEKQTNELRVQIHAIHQEVIKLAQATPKLAQEVKVAAIQAPIEASTYELKFLQHLFELIRSFREKIENASVWLEACNRRARRRNVWGSNYKKGGAKYLLSGEHYLTRSAG